MGSATGVYHTTYKADLALRHTRAEYARLALMLAAIVALPFLVSPYWLTIVNQIGIAIVGAIGLNILVGFTGQISLGQGGFLAIGAYTSGLLAARAGMPFPVDVACAVLATAVMGTLFGLPALRLKGLYLAIATLASQQIILWVVTHWDAVTGGTSALVVPPAVLLGWEINTDMRWYAVIALVATLSTLAAANLIRTGMGRAFVAIRDHEVAAEVIGVNPFRFKLLAFFIASAFVGLAGAMTARYNLIVTWERFTFDVSILYLAMIIVGGLGSVSGAIYGAAFMIAVPAWIEELSRNLSSLAFLQADMPAIQQLIFGLTIVLFLIFEPRGLAQIWQRSKEYLRLWPFR